MLWVRTHAVGPLLAVECSSTPTFVKCLIKRAIIIDGVVTGIIPQVGKITVGLGAFSKAQFSPPFSCAAWTAKEGFIWVLKQLLIALIHRSWICLT